MTADATGRRLEELTLRYSLAARQREQLASLLSIIGRDERAPTAVRSQEGAVDAHIADSLVALELEALRSASKVADVGAGAGFPGMALALALPASEFCLVESQRRKCTFMNEVLVEVGAQNARVVCERAEEWGEGFGQHDVVTARAVAAQPVVLEYAAPLLRLGGTLVDWRGKRARRMMSRPRRVRLTSSAFDSWRSVGSSRSRRRRTGIYTCSRRCASPRHGSRAGRASRASAQSAPDRSPPAPERPRCRPARERPSDRDRR